jgi:hypothetical protein
MIWRMEKESQIEDSSGRRGFVRKLLRFAALGGLAAAVLGQPVEKASASTNVTTDYATNARGTMAFWSGTPYQIGGDSDNVRWDDTIGSWRAGFYNGAGGASSTVPGGRYNEAWGDYSFAAGRRAKIGTFPGTHSGTFLFADSKDFDFNSVAAYEFAVRCTGGARFVTAIDTLGNPTFQMTLTPTGRLGIGTSAPEKLLHLRGVGPRILIEGTDNFAPEVNFKRTGDDLAIWSIYKHGENHDLRFYQNGDKVTIQNGTGNVGIGTTSPVAPLEVAGKVKVSAGTGVGQGALDAASSVFALSQDYWTQAEMSSHHDAGNPSFVFYRSKGTRTSPAAVANGDYVGSLFSRAYDGTQYSNCVGIRFAIDGAPGLGSLPSRITFHTSPAGSVGLTERMRIDNAGNVVPPSDISGQLGTSTKRWSDVWVKNLHQGDLTFENGVRSTEDGDGIAYYNPQGVKIARLDAQGNLHIKGKVVSDL